MKKILKINLLLMFLVSGFSFAQTLVTHDFNDNSLGPFNECTTRNPNYSRAENGKLVTHWREDGYAGNRLSAGAEACADQVVFSKEGWYGMKFELGADYSQHSQAAIAQIFGSKQEFGTWSGLLELEFGDLVAIHRRGAGNPDRATVINNVQNEREYSVIVHFILSGRNEGLFEVWIDGDRVYRAEDINFGLGNFNDDDVLDVPNHNFQTFKIGQYNYASNEYINNETRTVYYDDVSWYNGGSEGFDIVNPSQGSTPPTTGTFTPDPNKTYYIDVPAHNLRLAATGESEDAFTTSTNTTGDNVEWKFIDRGNGSWHIQLANGGSKPRLRTRNNGGETDMQETSSNGTWTYWDITNGASNDTYFLTLPDRPDVHARLQIDPDGDINMVSNTFNGSWESFTFTEVAPAIRVVQITKRNATGFAFDGNKGGANGQNLYLWNENHNNVNQQWIEIDRGNGYYSYQKMGTNFAIDGGNGGADKQNVYLWTINENNQNQHWQKVDAGGGAFKLVKRNAPDFALNGGNGGTDGQNINLFDSSSTSQNLQWYITEIPGVSAKAFENTATEKIVLYPNPVVSTVTIQGAANATIRIYDMNGKTMMTKNNSSENQTLDLSQLSAGIYYAQVNRLQGPETIKIVKQ